MHDLCSGASQDLACQLDRIATALEAGPTWVELLATVVVPMVLGISTLVVAVLSWRLALRVHRFEADSHLSKEQQLARKRRASFGVLLSQYSDVVVDEWALAGKAAWRDGGLRMIAPDSEPLRQQAERALLNEPGVHAHDVLARIRDSFVGADPRVHEDRAHLASLVRMVNRLTIADWVRDPQEWAVQDELHQAGRAQLLQSMQEREQS